MQAAQAPMLRPLGVGDVLDRTFNVYKSKPLLFIALSAIWYLLLVLAFIFLAVAVFAGNLTTFLREATTNPSPQLVGDVIAGVVVFVIIAVFLAILMLAAQSAALVYAGGRRYLAKDVTIGESFRAGLSAAGRLFVAGVLVFLAIVALWAVVFAVGAIIAVASRGSAVAVLVIGLATIVAIVGTFYLAASWLIAPVIVVVEKMGPLAALGRSWRLSDGNRWRIIGIQALLGVLNAVLSILIAGIFGAFAATSNEPGQFGAANVVENIVNFASTIIWAPVEWIAFTVLYYDLRVRKEAFDLQLAAEALPQS